MNDSWQNYTIANYSGTDRWFSPSVSVGKEESYVVIFELKLWFDKNLALMIECIKKFWKKNINYML